jgi:hypothetical protein
VSAAYWAGLQLSYDLQEARQMEPAWYPAVWKLQVTCFLN